MSSDVAKFHFRLVLLGSHGTGKTSILNKFLFRKFEAKYRPTVEDLFSKDFDLGCIEIKVDFLDTSGSMQFPAMRRLSISTGSAFLIVYAVDDDNSFEVLKMCIAEIQEIRPDYQEIPIVFAGNKCELPPERRKVSKELVSNYVHYEVPRLRTKVIECSCKEDINIELIFRAYLSLARVSLVCAPPLAGLRGAAPASSAGSLRARHHSSQPATAEGQIDERRPSGRPRRAASNEPAGQTPPPNNSQADQARASPAKATLGVRKSCDASIITSMRDVSITVTPEERLGQCSATKDQFAPADSTINEVILERAIRSKLNFGQQNSKPRSRSLIWRPSRRSRTPSAGEKSDCRVT